MDTPWYPGITEELFKDIKASYKSYAVEVIWYYVEEYLDVAVKLTDFMQPSSFILLQL